MTHVRLKDIAENLGISVSAVSKALKRSPEIGEEMTRKVIETAQQLGYHPNNSARALRLGRSFRIGVILPSFSGVYTDILAGIESYAVPKGYSVVVLNTQNKLDMEKTAISTLLSMPVDAILAVPVCISNFEGLSVTVAFLSRYPYMALPGLPEQKLDFSYIIVDDFQGQRIATQHLIECCRENIYIALGCSDLNNVWGIKDRIRIAGYRAALEQAGLPFQSDHIFWGATEIHSGYEVVSRICKVAEPPFGLCVTDDLVAIGALHALSDHHLRVPTDVSIVGYDNLEFCQHLVPPLTTIHNQKRSAGEFAAEHIIRILQTQKPQIVHQIFQPEICMRSSTCVCR